MKQILQNIIFNTFYDKTQRKTSFFEVRTKVIKLITECFSLGQTYSLDFRDNSCVNQLKQLNCKKEEAAEKKIFISVKISARSSVIGSTVETVTLKLFHFNFRLFCSSGFTAKALKFHFIVFTLKNSKPKFPKTSDKNRKSQKF